MNTIHVFFKKVILWKEKKIQRNIKYIYANFCPQLWEKSFYKHKNDQTKNVFHLATPVITWERISQLIKRERMTQRDIQLQNACIYVCVNVYPHTAWGYLLSWNVDKHQASSMATALKIPWAEDYIAHMPLKLSTLLNHECTCSFTVALWIYWHMLGLWDRKMKRKKK